MTEEEWLAANDPLPMLGLIRNDAGARKLQLFVCAACRRFWPLLDNTGLRHAVEVSEKYADGEATESELLSAADAAWVIVRPRSRNTPKSRVYWAAAWSTAPANRYFAENAIAHLLNVRWAGLNVLWHILGVTAPRLEYLSLAALVRDIFGNPFRPVTVDPRWRTETVVALAAGIYAERAFDRMPILADALEDAGCDNHDILAHCRRDGPHVRGCWVVDLLLGKE